MPLTKKTRKTYNKKSKGGREGGREKKVSANDLYARKSHMPTMDGRYLLWRALNINEQTTGDEKETRIRSGPLSEAK